MTMRAMRRGAALVVVLLLAVVLRPKNGSDSVPVPSASSPATSELAAPLPAAPPVSQVSLPIPATPPAASVIQDTASRNTATIRVTSPPRGSALRTALIDAVRRQVKTSSRFRVDHVGVAGRWAFLRATEVVSLERGEQQETDLTVAALLELPAGAAAWRVVDYWTLPTEGVRPLAGFKRRVLERLRVERLPSTLLPGDL
jgi:hypothetical protein